MEWHTSITFTSTDRLSSVAVQEIFQGSEGRTRRARLLSQLLVSAREFLADKNGPGGDTLCNISPFLSWFSRVRFAFSALVTAVEIGHWGGSLVVRCDEKGILHTREVLDQA
jgi:hypothetical protein